jgi:phosphoglycolate phosphatase
MGTSRQRLVVFDCYGTLVDSQHVIVACMMQAYAAHGLTAPEAASIRRVIGLPLLECMARLSPQHPEDRHLLLTEAYKEAFFASRQRPDHHEPLFDGALAALDRLEAQGYLLGVATGKARRGLDAVLDRHDIARRFVTLQTGDLGPGKPHPAMLERAMAETGVCPEDVIMIGDTSYDMLMARTAGVHAIGVAWGYHPAEELRAAGAHAVIDSFDALPDIFPSDRSTPCA